MPERLVYMIPKPSDARKDTSNSINQIVLRLEKRLPMYGWRITENPTEADLIAVHAGMNSYGWIADVAHCHGLYPTAHFDEPDKQWHYAANANVIQSLKVADYITVPSDWVADMVRRDLNRDAFIVPWGIDASEWESSSKTKGYTLWNKTRASAVCNPESIVHLANHFDDAQFVTTYDNGLKHGENLRVTGRMPFDDMQALVHDAALYIATTKETFGIGTLEAMACGVPILGYNWGATPDIVTHGVHGYLVEPNDLEGLITGWKWCMRNRQQLSHNAYKRTRERRFQWWHFAERFAEIYDEAYDNKRRRQETPIEVSVVIPCYNYGEYLAYAVNSVMQQDTSFKYEVIVADDCSTDDTPQVMQKLTDAYKQPQKLRYIRNNENSGVSKTRNGAIGQARGEFIVCLDADDALGAPTFLQTLYNAMQKEPLLGVAYTGLASFNTHKPAAMHKSTFPPEFIPHRQLEQNQVPTCNMFRKRAWEQAGKYKSYLEPAEDAHLWLSMIMHGWRIKRITDDPIFLYRLHDKSLSHTVRTGVQSEPHWKLLYHGVANNQNVPFGAMIPAPNHVSHAVRNYDKPLVSIITPVGAGHETNVIEALDSVMAQTEFRWEAIVINDTGKPLDLPYKWVKVIDKNGCTPVGAGGARNKGVTYANGQFILFLDADDTLLPNAIEKMLLAHYQTNRYVYSGWVEKRGNQEGVKVYQPERYNPQEALKRMLHSITILIPKAWVIDVGGFDETLESWEDWDFAIKLVLAGYCGTPLFEPLFVYNYDSGTRREDGVSQKEALSDIFKKRYFEFWGETMACKCDEVAKKRQANLASTIPDDELVRVRVLSGGKGKRTVVGASRRRYGRAAEGDVLFIHAEDARAEPDRFAVLNTKNDIRPTPEPPPPPRYEKSV